MKIYDQSTENAYEACESLEDALNSYKEFRAEIDDTVEDDDEIYLVSGVDAATGKRYYAIQDNPEYGASCTPACLATFASWWDTKWDDTVAE